MIKLKGLGNLARKVPQRKEKRTKAKRLQHHPGYPKSCGYFGVYNSLWVWGENRYATKVS